MTGIQVTSMSNVAAREKKMKANPLLRKWIESGGQAVIHGWSKKGPRGKRKLWTLTVRAVCAEPDPSRDASAS